MSQSASTTRFAPLIAALARPQDVRGLNLTGLHIVMAMRLCALFENAGRDPVPDLAQRYRSVEAACAVHGLVATIKQVWPEPFMVNRPCCLSMTPDEATLATLVRAAAGANRPLFADAIDGFVRADRHNALYESTVHAVALIPAP
ncbi:hypothetical protein OVA07_09065 [Novosphingobium sp. SL115]|uniref:hypothetical protein n=1 Tax=Novosphingobium sp. SL115 TaxID=2995150 RepID=UPI002272FC0F|nr:hypothetical protein [Novosphingobium sp. SL115]MCY1671162.1 hypothetical protein [Novosphingobium sp. SL115]